MRWSDLQDIKNTKDIPEKGQMLAYTRTKVIFHEYDSLETVAAELAEEDLLELHLFDSEKEYRSVSTIGRRFRAKQGVIETLVDFPENEKDNHSGIGTVYSERILLDTDKGQDSGAGGHAITVLNHIRYNPENGMAAIDNYRLKM